MTMPQFSAEHADGLRHAAAQVRERAAGTSDIARTIDSMLGSLTWQGPAADRARAFIGERAETLKYVAGILSQLDTTMVQLAAQLEADATNVMGHGMGTPPA